MKTSLSLPHPIPLLCLRLIPVADPADSLLM
jgi:hypothetical protein